MADSANPGGTVLGGLPAGLVRAAAGVLIVAAVVFLVLGLILPPTRELKEEKQVPVETAAQTTPTPPATGVQPAPSGRLVADFYARENLISGAYKVYGQKDGLWLAKSVFRNDTGAPISNLQVRYRLGEYADWCTWQNHPMLVPTQTVVDLYHPYLSSKCTTLTTKAPAEVQIEWKYTDAQGREQTGQTAKPLTVLGRGDFIFSDLAAEEKSGSFQDEVSNADMLAAYVTSKDEPVEQLASEANKQAGGIGATSDDESCIKVMAELYDHMRSFITYQYPSTTYQRGKDSFNIRLVQALQYPRDTIRKRSGTCIDLAILYAAMLHSVNIRPRLVVLDGHCFPIGVSPSGAPIPVEVTFVGGGPNQSGTFKEAVEFGIKEWKELQQSGRYYVVDCQTCWMAGISPAELEPIRADVLDMRKLIEEIRPIRARLRQQTAQPPDNTNPPPRAAALQSGAYAVTLTNTATNQQSSGQAVVAVNGEQFGLAYQFDYQGVGPDGRQHAGREVGKFIGTIRGQAIAARSRDVVWTMDGQNIPPQGLPYDMALTIAADGKSADGAVTMSNGNRFQWSMRFQRAAGGDN